MRPLTPFLILDGAVRPLRVKPRELPGFAHRVTLTPKEERWIRSGAALRPEHARRKPIHGRRA